VIGLIRGRVVRKSPECLIVDVGGVGYEVTVPVRLLAEISESEEVTLLVHTHVREDALVLYGFGDEREKRVFRTLLNVTGVGPKLALNILSGGPVDDFLRAVDAEDTALLTRLPGVGKKTAERIIFELREKLPADTPDKDSVYGDALSALVNLGYRKTDARSALDSVYKQGDGDIETLLKEALKILNR
jgi:Holliday junction DNA helicase RuvA